MLPRKIGNLGRAVDYTRPGSVGDPQLRHGRYRMGLRVWLGSAASKVGCGRPGCIMLLSGRRYEMRHRVLPPGMVLVGSGFTSIDIMS